jgi:adenylyltransferase/sulfurtransferase
MKKQTMIERYSRQLALPEITFEKQEKLAQTTLLMVGAGGLGSAALPYLVGAGIGKVVLADDDRIDISNLHRQIMYKTEQEGRVKATMAGAFLTALNPDIDIYTIDKHINKQNATTIVSEHSPDLLLDGSDNFETKTLLNDISVAMHIPFICSSITNFEGQIGTFEGYKANTPLLSLSLPRATGIRSVNRPLGHLRCYHRCYASPYCSVPPFGYPPWQQRKNPFHAHRP